MPRTIPSKMYKEARDFGFKAIESFLIFIKMHKRHACQTCTVLSLLAEAMRVPSGDQVTPKTKELWPR